MNYRIEVAPEAKAEILNARDWYEDQLPGLGKSFSDAIKQHIARLKSDKTEHKIVFTDIRRVLVKRFPYVIYYTRNEEKKLVKILAVLHDRQNKRLI